MPMIDLETLKHGLLPVQQAEARYKQASAARIAGSDAGADMAPLFDAEDQAYWPIWMPASACTATSGGR